MRKLNTYFIFCLLIALSITVFAEDANTIAESQAAATEDVAVTVNGKPIKQSLVDKIVASKMDMLKSQGLPQEFADQYARQIQADTVSDLIEETLLIQKVGQEKIEVTEEQKNELLTEMASRQQPPMSVELFKAMLVKNGQDINEVDRQIINYLSIKKLIEKISQDKIADVNETEAKAFYDENPRQFSTPEQIRVSHILIGFDDIDPNSDVGNEKKIHLKKIEELLEKIKNGADFAKLAKNNSTDISKIDGGDIGYFQKGQIPKPFEDAAFALEPNDISDIVETQFGYHIIKLTDKIQVQTTPFEQVKNKIIEALTEEKKNQFVVGYVETLKAEADIVYPKAKEESVEIAPTVPEPPVDPNTK